MTSEIPAGDKNGMTVCKDTTYKLATPKLSIAMCQIVIRADLSLLVTQFPPCFNSKWVNNIKDAVCTLARQSNPFKLSIGTFNTITTIITSTIKMKMKTAN